MVDDHKEDITKFKQESQKSGDVAEFAKNTLPVLEKHLQTAESLTAIGTTGSSH
jgi:putative membrane protein